MSAQRPNILLITSDQHRGDVMGCAGHPCVQTPHLDMLAGEGTMFNRAYTDCPICIPARTTMITGIQSHHYGCPSYSPEFRISRDRNDFMPAVLTASGYQTELIGKTHWHTPHSFRAGFEHHTSYDVLARQRLAHSGGISGNLTGIGANEFSPALSPWPEHLHSTNWAIDRSIEFLLDREKEQPFFLWTSMIDPHPGSMIHEPYFSLYDRERIPQPVQADWSSDAESLPYPLRIQHYGNAHAHLTPAARDKAVGIYYGMITNLDHQLGRLLGTLMNEGLWENTIVMYTSDHGECLGDHGMYHKGNFLDGACRIPMIARLPHSRACCRGQKSDALVQLADLFPTFCNWAETDSPSDIDGQDLSGLIAGKKDHVRDVLHAQISQAHMWLTHQDKYLYFSDDGSELLFDPVNDPKDTCDLSAEKPDQLRACRDALAEHLKSEDNDEQKNGILVNRNKIVSERENTNMLGWMGLGSAGAHRDPHGTF